MTATKQAGRLPRSRFSALDRISTLLVALAAALWVTDVYFRPALASKLSAAQIVFVEDLLITLCFVPVALRVFAEVRRLDRRRWLALAIIAVGPQAMATVLFTRSLGYAFSAHGVNLNVENEVYFLYLLQPFFGALGARLALGERRRPYYWPLALLAFAGAYLIVFPDHPLAPFSAFQHAQLEAALFVLGAVVLWAAGTVMGRYALHDVSFVSTTAMRFTLALPVLLILLLTDRTSGGFSSYSITQLPSFLGIALIPGLVAMLLYYRALSSTPASLATFAELAYPCTLFLVFSLPPPVGQGVPIRPMEVLGVIAVVAAVTTLNALKTRGVVRGVRASARAAPAASG